ncbi:MAG: DNA topoisomerase VI subunit B [Nitrososphaerota archaeon]
MAEVKFEKISPADFFYRNRDIAGFTNPSRSLYTSIRELVENSLDACEVGRILPEVIVELQEVGEGSSEDVKIFRLRVKDNGIGVDAEHIPHAFATVFYGSKYGYRQSRGTFGLGGTMALLYGQITTNRPVTVISCKDGDIHEFVLRIDIVENKPIVLDHKVHKNNDNWRGTIIDYYLEADYTNSKAKIVEYFRNTAIANPNASLTFIDPKGRLYYFPRVAEKVPEPPKEALPHPVGVDVETMKRLISATKSETLLSFLTSSFQRVGPKTAREVLELAGLAHTANPKELNHDQLTALVENIADAGRYDPETGFYDMMLVPTDPNEVVRKITSTYLIPTEKADLKVEVKVQSDTPIIYADQNMLERAAINLLDNAVKYTPNGGRVTISVFTAQNRLYFQVEDTGGGIKPEDLRKLFQRHVRLRHPEHRQVRGAGLGLFIVRTVAIRHGGDAFVHSELGKGSTFGIWIPLNEQTLVPL